MKLQINFSLYQTFFMPSANSYIYLKSALSIEYLECIRSNKINFWIKTVPTRIHKTYFTKKKIPSILFIYFFRMEKQVGQQKLKPHGLIFLVPSLEQCAYWSHRPKKMLRAAIPIMGTMPQVVCWFVFLNISTIISYLYIKVSLAMYFQFQTLYFKKTFQGGGGVFVEYKSWN